MDQLELHYAVNDIIMKHFPNNEKMGDFCRDVAKTLKEEGFDFRSPLYLVARAQVVRDKFNERANAYSTPTKP